MAYSSANRPANTNSSSQELNELYKKNFLENPNLVKDSIFYVKPLLLIRKLTDCLENSDNFHLSGLGRIELIDLFYEAVRKSKSQNRVYYYLYEAAKESNFTYLCDILSDNLTKEKTFGLDYASACLEIFDLCENIKPIDELILMKFQGKGLLTEPDKDYLTQELDREGPIAAFTSLIHMIKKRNSEWYTRFFEVLTETKNQDAIKAIDPELLKRLEKNECFEENFDECHLRNVIKEYFQELFKEHFGIEDITDEDVKEQLTTDFIQSQTQNEESAGACVMAYRSSPDNPIGSVPSTKILSPKNNNSDNIFSWDDFLNDDFLRNSEPRKVERIDFVLRPYQNELARRALNGENVIICAPTGSGKTHVAAKIAQEHLKSEHPNHPKRKVAFLVHRVNLVDQQYALFNQLLTQFDIKVNKFSGGSGVTDGACVPIKYALCDCDIMVLTADILLNALNTDDELTKIESLEELSLIIFDECHNCTKGHPYNRIMIQYFNDKDMFRKVPQIVGLTASPGTNKANNLRTAFDHLITLCANMDAYYIQTVVDEHNLRNLDDHNRNPQNKVISSQRRNPDVCEEVLNQLMYIAEQMLVKLHCQKHIFDPRYDVSNYIRAPEDRGHSIYTNFVGKLATLHTMAIQDPEVYRNSAYCIYKYLNIYDRAFKLNRLFREKDTAKFIREELEVDKPNFRPTCQLDEFLMNRLKDSPIVQGFTTEVKNPALEDLKKEILDQLSNFPDSRIIVFLKQRVYTQLMKDYFQSDEDLSRIPSDLIVGANAGLDEGGATKVWQREVLLKFKDGTNKVLFSTTVAEEGLDVVKCNLVIRYGHITNETAMIQTKGRARAELSKYVVIVPFGEEWQKRKEQVNVYREDLMKQAINKFIHMNAEDRKDEIVRAQRVAYSERKLELVARRKKEKNNDGIVFDLHCIRCNAFFCKSTNFRLAQGVHRFMTKTDYYNKFKIVETKTPPRPVGSSREFFVGDKITCANCGQDFGMVAIFKQMAYPVISIGNFSLKDEDGIVRTVKKWKDAPFNVQNITSDEIHERSINFGNRWITSEYYNDAFQRD